MRGGIDRGDYRFPSRFVGVVHVLNQFWSGDGTLSSSGGAKL